MSDDFYASVPVFDSFARVMDQGVYRPVPADWQVAFTDVVQSTQAIAEGRYKAVNMAGAAAIAAVSNALGGRQFPFAFGGDGAEFAVAAADAPAVRQALAATAGWVRDDLGLDLRTALVPVAAIRAAGRDVTVARFAPSPDISYAMFAGGGIAWVDQAVKGGAFLVEPAPPGARPDLAGLSCRWDLIQARRGLIVSLLVLPGAGGNDAAYRAVLGAILARTGGRPAEAGHPLPDGGPPPSWPPAGLALEAAIQTPPGWARLKRRLWLYGETLFGFALLRWNWRAGAFDPIRYKRELVQNSDFRKFDDGLRMTLDCTPALADRLEARLRLAAAAGTVRYGLHRQTAAQITCIVPSVFVANHVHFVDGAEGGYTAAARAMKAGSG